MKAARILRFGPPNVITIEDVPRPEPGAGQLLVRVKAAGIGNWDVLTREGKLHQPLPLILGGELSEIAEAVLPLEDAHIETRCSVVPHTNAEDRPKHRNVAGRAPPHSGGTTQLWSNERYRATRRHRRYLCLFCLIEPTPRVWFHAVEENSMKSIRRRDSVAPRLSCAWFPYG